MACLIFPQTILIVGLHFVFRFCFLRHLIFWPLIYQHRNDIVKSIKKCKPLQSFYKFPNLAISTVHCYSHHILVPDVSITYFLLYITESFNWTAQPTNPTTAIEGQDVSLAWQYSLTADELIQSQTQFTIFWKKLNMSTSNYDKIGTKGYVQSFGGFGYHEPQSPRIVIDRSDQATLHIKDVRREDEGTYKIEFSLKADGSILAEQRVNVSLLGKL